MVVAARTWWSRDTLLRRLGVVVLQVPGLGLDLQFFLQPDPSHQTAAGLMIDTILRLAGVVHVLAVLALVFLDDRSAARAGLVAAAASGLLATAVVLVSAWSEYRDDHTLLLSIAVVVSAVLSTVIVGRGRAIPRPSIRSIFASSLVVTVLTTSFTFWQAYSFLPSERSVTLTATQNVELQTTQDGVGHWRYVVKLDNPADVRAFIVISALRMCARSSDVAPVKEDVCRDLEERPFVELSWINPKGSVSYATSVPVDLAMPYVHFGLRVLYGRGDRLGDVPGSPRDARPEEMRPDCSKGRIIELFGVSRLRSLALHENLLLFAKNNHTGGLSWSISTSDRTGCPALTDPALVNYYDLTEFNGSTASLPVQKAPAAAAGGS